MRRFEQVAQFVGDDVGIDLCRRNVGVTEQELHGAKVCAARQQMRSESVAQGMRRHAVRSDAGFQGEVFEDLAEAAACETSTGAA